MPGDGAAQNRSQRSSNIPSSLALKRCGIATEATDKEWADKVCDVRFRVIRVQLACAEQ